jgi:hypothetical protein
VYLLLIHLILFMLFIHVFCKVNRKIKMIMIISIIIYFILFYYLLISFITSM